MSLPLCAIAAIPEGKRMRIVIAGEIDLATAPLLRDEIDEVILIGWLDITIDLRNTTFADSSTLHVLLDTHQRLRERDGTMTILTAHGPMDRLVRISGAGPTLSTSRPQAA